MKTFSIITPAFLLTGFLMGSCPAMVWGQSEITPAPYLQADPALYYGQQAVNPAAPVQKAPPMNGLVPPQPQQIYSETTVEDLSKELAAIKKELAKKSDKPDPKKGFTPPKFGGRIFMDSVSVLNQNDDNTRVYGQGQNLAGFREARLTATGTGYGFLDYKLELGYETSSGNNVNLKDMFLGIQHTPFLEYVRIGNQYVEDGGSEIVNGTTNYTFMEMPSPAGDQFTSRRLGISSRHLFAQDRGRLFLGVFDAKSMSGANHTIMDDNHGVMFNARLTYAPMYSQDGRCLFLFGGYYNYVDYANDATTTSTVRPGTWGVNINTLNSRAFLADSLQKVGFESIYQNGGFCLQGDVFLMQYQNAIGSTTVGTSTLVYDDNGNKTNYGGFVMARQFLTTGDYRKYTKDGATWGAVDVKRPFFLYERGNYNCACGPGAWELAGYYGFMNNEDFSGMSSTNGAAANIGAAPVYGVDHELGLALNWYWNPQVKWAFNYVHQMSDVTVKTQAGINPVVANDFSPNSDYLGVSCRINF